MVALLGLGALAGCGPGGQSSPSGTADRVEDFLPQVVASSAGVLVSWEEVMLDGSRPTVVELVREAGEKTRLAVADGVQVATDGSGRVAAFSNTGLTDTYPGGVVRVDLSSGALQQLTVDEHVAGVPDDRPWTTLAFAHDGVPVWLTLTDPPEGDEPHDIAYALVRYADPAGKRELVRFPQISYMGLSPDRHTMAFAASRLQERPMSLWLVDVDTGEAREQLAGAGVGSVAFSSPHDGFAVVGKPARRRSERSVDALIEAKLFAPRSAVVYWRDDGTRRDLQLSLGGQYPELVHASPDGRHLAVVAWRRDGEQGRRSNLWLIDIEARTETNLTPQARTAGGPSFSPTGETLVYGQNRQLVRYDVQQATSKPVFGEPIEASWGRQTTFAWRDGEELLCFSNRRPDGRVGRLSLWVSGPHGALRHLATRPVASRTE